MILAFLVMMMMVLGEMSHLRQHRGAPQLFLQPCNVWMCAKPINKTDSIYKTWNVSHLFLILSERRVLQNSKTAHLKNVVRDHILWFPSFALTCIIHALVRNTLMHTLERNMIWCFLHGRYMGKGRARRLMSRWRIGRFFSQMPNTRPTCKKLLGECKIILILLM